MLIKLLQQKYFSTPEVTRHLFTLIFFISILHHMKYLNNQDTCFSFWFIIHRMQFYRLILPVLTFSINSLDSILSLFFSYKYCGMIESLLSRAQFVSLLTTIIILLNILSLIWDINISSCFSCAITYIWTRFNPSTQVALMGFVVFPSFYLPFIIPSLVFFMENRIPYDELAGILTGHIVYFGWVVLPKLSVFQGRHRSIVTISNHDDIIQQANNNDVTHRNSNNDVIYPNEDIGVIHRDSNNNEIEEEYITYSSSEISSSEEE